MHNGFTFMRRSRAGLAAVAVALACTNPAAAPNGPAPDPLSATYAPSLGINISEYQVTTNGALTRDSVVGGGLAAVLGKRVTIRYIGYLTDGTIFDKNTAATDSALVFTVGAGSVITGFDDGVSNMRVGGRRMVVIPPKLGYGGTPKAGIPANSILIFWISLTQVQ
jgi:FKBP-type peptidyl-prolyl cis-trans isomerase FkpA